ncbi:MAG TPA: ATP-grasp domain-containing protein [Aliiroseovarius sp.]|nr:ATP-grasp domain-containing protein [Aliiroseovarius sp.]
MFHKILIANRGEIACRVMETAHRLGVATVAVYSDADAGARHTAMADEAVHIGGAAPAQSYLRGDVIIRAALDKGAQAIHPGYGFLSENPDFVDACVAAGLVFIGPSAEAIRAMGLKDAAKALMQEAGVPVVPGYHGADQDDALLAREAAKVGYPVMIKAVAGGGGKGMRLVEGPDAFDAALTSARNEAGAAFGNDAVLIEKFVQKPRHIEVQVFGDGIEAVHLYERDCSLQRRHQKVIEEAPAPGMTADMRAAMGAAAVAAAKAIGYAGAGTVEFIVDGSGGLRADRFWFMEMNTRLQVEHPVTESVTGIDLVEWQLRVASGEGLPRQQDEITLTGHAFEARLYAEDAGAGFLPATGRLTHLTFPAIARADSGVRKGDIITPYYDPMIAKLIVHGATRRSALRRLGAALERTEVAGLTTNLGFLSALVRHAGFAGGDVDTGLIGRDLDQLVVPEAPEDADWALAGLAALGLLERQGDGFHLWTALNRSVYLKFADQDAEVIVKTLSRNEHLITVGGRQLRALCMRGQWEIDGERAVQVAVAEDVITLFRRSALVFHRLDPLAQVNDDSGVAGVILAPMPGLVREVLCAAGQEVAAGDRLAVLEAMKMEHALVAPREGVVAEVLTDAGAQVEAGAALIRLHEDTGAGADGEGEAA